MKCKVFLLTSAADFLCERDGGKFYKLIELLVIVVCLLSQVLETEYKLKEWSFFVHYLVSSVFINVLYLISS